MKRHCESGPTPVAGFAARAPARALRVDLGHPDRYRLTDGCLLERNDGRAAATGSGAGFR